MHISRVLLLVVTVSCFSVTAAVPASCTPEWKIDWNQQFPSLSNFQPFENPGEILPDVTINDTLKFVGLLWNANSWQEIAGRFCVEFGPFLYASIQADGPGFNDPNIRRECDSIITSLQKGTESDIYEECSSYWRQVNVENQTQQLLSNYETCLHYDLIEQESISYDSYESVCVFDPFKTIYYNNILEKTSRIAFKLLEWFGPSPFSGDLYGACSALRILLSNSIDDLINELKKFVTYPVADTLEYIKRIDLCSSEDETVQEILYLLPISQQDNEYICDFLRGNPSRDEYIEKGGELVNTILSVPVDVELCNAVLEYITSYDQNADIGYQITGRTLTNESIRRQLCREVSSALSINSVYIPMEYSFPEDQNISGWMIDAGQLLPNFYFIDAVNVLGAFLRSDKLLDGGIVLCDVFESFLSEYEPSVRSICAAFRKRDAAGIEKMCLTISFQHTSPYSQFHPSLRIPTLAYLVVTGVDWMRQLFDLPAISREYVCSSLDGYFHSNNNLQSLVRFSLNICLAELLPIANNICNDYDSVLHYLRERTRFSPSQFRNAVSSYTNVFLTHLGFSSRRQICQVISDGINNDSGRATSSLIETIQDRALVFLTDSNRCVNSLKSYQRLIDTLSQNTYDFPKYFTLYTGFMDFQSLCDNIATFFDPELCKDSATGTKANICSMFLAFAAWIVCRAFRF